jgi:hypothetical protein
MSFAQRPSYSLGALAFVLAACSSDSDNVTSAARAQLCPSSGEYGFVCGVQNAEDLVLLPESQWVISSGMAPGAPIYLIDSQTKLWSNLYPGDAAQTDFDTETYLACPGEPDLSNFITHGLNVRTGRDGRTRLYAVSHGEREAIEVFDVDTSSGTPALTWIGCVQMPEGLEANSVASLDDGSLVATVLIHPEFTFEDSMAGRPTGAVYAWSPGGSDFERIDGTELPANNGIEVSADGSEIYVASSGLRTVVAFDRANPSRQLRTTTPMPIIPDNIHMGADGNLITAGTIIDEPACGGLPDPSEFDIAAYAQCPRGFMALSIDPETMQYTTIAQGSANAAFSNATMALEVGDEVWVGTFAGDRIGYVSRD